MGRRHLLFQINAFSLCLTVFVQQFNQEIQLGHVLQILMLINMIYIETDDADKQTDHHRDKYHLLYTIETISRWNALPMQPHRNQRPHQAQHRSVLVSVLGDGMVCLYP